MTRLTVTLVLLTALASCGIDGPPMRPAQQSAPGIALSGDAQIGIRTNDL